MSKLVLFLLITHTVFSQQQFERDSVIQFQKNMNEHYADSAKSPLKKKDLAIFQALEFFSINEKYFVKATFKRSKKEKPFEMKTSTDRKPLYVKYGEAYFTIDGSDFKLNIYRNIELSKKAEYKDYLFLPFSDLTSGNESYIGGKYIDMKVPEGNTIIIDFNTSYNPYCAYNHKYSCPKVPLENDLNIEIKAGVKKFHD